MRHGIPQESLIMKWEHRNPVAYRSGNNMLPELRCLVVVVTPRLSTMWGVAHTEQDAHGNVDRNGRRSLPHRPVLLWFLLLRSEESPL